MNQIMYRHVILPVDIARHVPTKTHLMTETEWRNWGVQQSPGWVHYMMHGPGTIRQIYLIEKYYVYMNYN